MHPVFITAAAVVACAFVLILFLREVPLRMQSGIQARMAEEGGEIDPADDINDDVTGGAAGNEMKSTRWPASVPVRPAIEGTT
jgi:hypothetical protein